MFADVVIDLILVLIFVAGAIYGAKSGFINTVAKPVKFVCALLIAFNLCVPVADAIIQPIIQEPITFQITEYLNEQCQHLTSENLAEEMPTLLKLAAGMIGIDINGELFNTENIIAVIVENLAVPVIHILSVIIGFILLYFISKIVLSVAICLLNAVFDNGLTGIINKVVGGVLGAFFGFVISWAAATMISFLIGFPFMQQMQWVSEFSGGIFYNFLGEYNPIDILLSF